VKYGRALVLTAVLAVPVGLAFLLLVAGGSFAEAMRVSYGWSDDTVDVWNAVRWPIGLVLLVFTVAVLLDHAPRRRQPGLSWLALGAGLAVLLTMLATGLLAVYIQLSGSFSETYGPLAGIFALLLWSLLSSIALFAGAAVCAQLESLRAGLHEPALDDPGPPPDKLVHD
jgi:YihY family inner membrane protein